jgi:Protein of unknown function (DUF3617)
MKKRTILLALTVATTTLLPGVVLAQKKVPGEKWKTTVSMESAGMSMPARTTELCAPIGKAEESMARPDGNSNCSVYDTQRAGNKFSAKMRCTGETPMEGSMEMVTEGNTMRGTTRMKMQGMDMTMKYESTKLGTACEALDYSDYKPPVVAAPQAVDTCKMMSDQLASGKMELSQAVAIYVGDTSQCGKHASMKNYCSAVQTPKGFSSLKQQETAMSSMQGGDKTSPYAIPLTSSLRACGLGTDKAAIDSLKKRLLVVAETNGDWDFLVLEGDDSTFAMLTATAKKECSGRSYTSASSSKYTGLCSRYAAGLIRGDRNAVMQAAGGSEDSGSGSAAAGTSGSPTTPAEAAPPASTTDKAKETLDKGKKALRGLFGG